MTEVLEVIDLHKHYPLPQHRWKLLLDPKFLLGRYKKTQEIEPFRAVNGVSFSIQQGECVGLVGESGSGKSTLARMIARLLDVTSGQIRFQNTDISLIPSLRFGQWPQRQGIQMVFQDPHDSLNPARTAFACIAEPLYCLAKVSDQHALKQKVAQLADQVGLPQELLSRYPHQLSGGQKARVGIARAIALNPKLILLDEPTTALDVSVQSLILKLLAQLQQQLGLSYLFVTHDLNVVRLLSQRILVMKQGQIIEEGSCESIFKNPQHEYTQALLKAIPRGFASTQ